MYVEILNYILVYSLMRKIEEPSCRSTDMTIWPSILLHRHLWYYTLLRCQFMRIYAADSSRQSSHFRNGDVGWSAEEQYKQVILRVYHGLLLWNHPVLTMFAQRMCVYVCRAWKQLTESHVENDDHPPPPQTITASYDTECIVSMQRFYRVVCVVKLFKTWLCEI